MSNRNQDKQQYDVAQKVGERVERMCSEEGWKLVFIPMIQKKRDEAQLRINDLGTNPREADFNRGLLESYDYILGYEEEKKAQSSTIMRNTATRG
tara:strand:+ start:952 stop:1236 length:285 start_codon:yes stop_codon:yes gene_type:complete